MKQFFIILSVLWFFNGNILAQEPLDDPLSESRIIRNGAGKEIANMSTGSYYDNGNWYRAVTVDIYKYFKAQELTPNDTMVQTLRYTSLISGYSEVFYDIAAADLDADDLDEIAAVWTIEGKIKMAVLKPEQNLLGIDSLASWQDVVEKEISGPAVYNSGQWFLPSVCFVQTGNFDQDANMEFVVAYWAEGSYVHLSWYDVSDSMTVEQMGSVMDQKIEIPAKIAICEDMIYMFDIECGDFDQDGIDEIILTGRSAQDNGWQIFANFYQVNEQTNQIELLAGGPAYIQQDPTYDVGVLNIASGHFFDQETESAVISVFQYCPDVYQIYPNPPDDTVSVTIIPVSYDQEQDTIQTGNMSFLFDKTIKADCIYNRISTLRSADFNNDGYDELTVAHSMYGGLVTQGLKIFSGGSGNNVFSVWADLDNLVPHLYADIGVGDIRIENDSTNKQMELIVPERKNYATVTNIYSIQTDVDGNFATAEKIAELKDLGGAKIESMISADFDGDIRLGLPRMFSVTKILQPLVILNAPPIHFDILDDKKYDVCFSYNGSSGEFVSSYIKESSQFAEVQTEVNMDWSLSWSASAGFSMFGVSVSSHLSETYGKRFSKVQGSSTKVTVGIAVDAIEDDRIYAMVMDYTIWEYPVYVNKEYMGDVMVVRPNVVENRWFPSKSWSGYDYIPNHEVGNILSYREYPALSNNPMLDEKIKGDYNNSFVLDANSSYDWFLKFDDFQSNQVTTAKEFTRDWGMSVSGWGMGFSLNGSYSREDIQTQRTEVASGLEVDVHLAAIDRSLGEVGYIVTPYSYWATNGALVIDFAVKPELAAPGGTLTWWQVHYGDWPDAAFILPWRYDPEKGFPLQDPAKRYQTKDITFFPTDPADGAVVTIEARVHNFSLVQTPHPMGVKFYLGDPDSDGVLIESVDGKTEVFTDEAIPARGTKMVTMDWKTPYNLGAFPRIYAVIDEGEELPEIHENNNKSWAILQKSSASAIPDRGTDQIPQRFELGQNYPNPFNPVTRITFSIPKSERVNLEIFNTLGERVSTIVARELSAGNYAYDFDGRLLPSGLYFYRLTAGDFYEVRKMILIR